jgi:hypothetical protein
LFTFPDISFYLATDSHDFLFPSWHRFLADLKACLLMKNVRLPANIVLCKPYILTHSHVSIFVSIEAYLHRLYTCPYWSPECFLLTHGNLWISFIFSFWCYCDSTVLSFYLHMVAVLYYFNELYVMFVANCTWLYE